MSSIRFTEDHEWIVLGADGVATVGITHHAQDALGDIVFVELPELGAHFEQGDAACVVESVKAAAEVKMPVSGTVTEVNSALVDDPAKVNSDPQGEGWFIKIKPDDSTTIETLLDSAAYEALTAQ
jgi:glycine cleavage system H protein